MKNSFIYIGIVLLFFSCKKEIGPQNTNTDGIGIGSLFVINEGNFGFGNASISKLNPETGEIFNNQYRLINGVGIGDVLQSVKRHRDKYYFVVNNSGKIVVTDTNLVFQNEITGFNSPRYMEFYNNLAFVTDLKQKAVYVVELTTNSIISQIPTQGWTEDIVVKDGNLLVLDRGDYLTNSDSNWVYTIDASTVRKTDSLKVGVNANSMQLDGNGELWVLSSGTTGNEVPSLTEYDVDAKTVQFQYNFPSQSNPSRLAFSHENERLYWIDNSIYSIPSSGLDRTPSLFYQKQSENFYGLSVCGQTICATDAKNFVQSGNVVPLSLDGNLKNILSVGLIPSLVFR